MRKRNNAPKFIAEQSNSIMQVKNLINFLKNIYDS